MNLRYIKGSGVSLGINTEITKMELERCEHCQREIPSVNFVMHVAHCQRNVQICTICSEPVSKVNWQEHQEEHKPVTCNLCGKGMPKGRLENHVENSCLKREVECFYCGLDMSFSELNDHEVYCGSRTEPCESCKNYVMIKDFSTHICDGMRSSGSTSPTIEDIPEDTAPCEYCKLQLPIDQLMVHESACSVSKDHDVEIIDDNASTIPRGRKRSHEEEIAEDFDSALDETTDGCHGEEAKQENVVYALPCEVCGELCPSDRLMDHQRQCLYRTENQGASSSRDEPIDDDDDDGMWFNNLSLHDGRTTEHFPRLDAFDLMVRFQPFFAGSFFHQRFNQRYFS